MAPHHMLDVVHPLTEFCVTDFNRMALPIIGNLLERRIMPIIVGGTNYYIESLLWKILIKNPLSDDSSQESKKEGEDEEDEELNFANLEQRSSRDSSKEMATREKDNGDGCPPLKKTRCFRESDESSEELHQRLTEVDPDMARALHPNNRRKIIRSLEIYERFGQKHSELLKAQRMEGGCGLGGPLRYRNTILLWLRCDKEVLEERLYRRVDAMLEAGLVKELLDFHHCYNESRIKLGEEPDYTKGIFQSIGFKEFHDYLILSEEEKHTEMGRKLLEKGIEDLKRVTRRYAKRQERWITNRFIRRADREVPPIYSLDCTNVDQWTQSVYEPAVKIVSSILKGETPSQLPLNISVTNAKTDDASNEITRHCEICQRYFIGDLQWFAHINGQKHARVAKRHEKRKKTKEDEQDIEKDEKSEKEEVENEPNLYQTIK
ncbi:tRNA dimethylallyltransferase isoform X2 [Prorops nasuta]